MRVSAPDPTQTAFVSTPFQAESPRHPGAGHPPAMKLLTRWPGTDDALILHLGVRDRGRTCDATLITADGTYGLLRQGEAWVVPGRGPLAEVLPGLSPRLAQGHREAPRGVPPLGLPLPLPGTWRWRFLRTGDPDARGALPGLLLTPHTTVVPAFWTSCSSARVVTALGRSGWWAHGEDTWACAETLAHAMRMARAIPLDGEVPAAG